MHDFLLQPVLRYGTLKMRSVALGDEFIAGITTALWGTRFRLIPEHALFLYRRRSAPSLMER
jgi:hypothetical protein